MRKMVPVLSALLALGVASPALAGNVYIPVLDRSGAATEVYIANSGLQERRYATFFIPAGADGTTRPATPATRTLVLGGRTSKVTGVTTPGQIGLLEIDAAPQLAVDARLRNPNSGGAPVFYTSVPVITSANALPPNSIAHLLGLARSSAGAFSDLGVINLATQGARCSVSFYRANGSQIGGTATVDVPPLSLRNFGDALGLVGEGQAVDARSAVTCDRQFYAYAGVFSPETSSLSFAVPAGTGASTLGGGTATPPPAGNAIVFTRDGSIHTPATGNESSSFVVPVSSALSLRRMVIEWDVTPGSFTAGKEDKGHALIWAHRGKFRSNTIANVNVFGTPRNEIKNTTNLDVPPSGLSAQQAPFVLQQGQTYRLRYVYDAENRQATLTVSAGGTVLTTLNQQATAPGRLTIPATGFFIQFGHTAAQAAEGFEFPTYGWNYANLRVEMYP